MSTLYNAAKYRTGAQAYVRFAGESAMLAPDANALGAYPAAIANDDALLGYISRASARAGEGTQSIEGLGDYRDIDLVPGARTAGISFGMQLGRGNLLRYALRSSEIGGIGTSGCLPVLSLALGAKVTCGSNDSLTWLLRYGLINTMSIQAQNGSGTPVTADFDVMGITWDTAPPILTSDETKLRAQNKSVLTWHNVGLIHNGINYRNILQNVSLSINNNVQPAGPFREDFGPLDPLSRTATQIRPHGEKLQVSCRLFDDIPAAVKATFRTSAVQLIASDSAVNSVNPQTLAITISNQAVSETALDNITPNGDFGFSSQYAARLISITHT